MSQEGEGAPTPPRAPEPSELNSAGRLSRIHPFTSRRFHVLLNSLFKVLFNFLSRYLSAIGLVPVFSLRWSLPPALGCIPKQPDTGANTGRRTGHVLSRCRLSSCTNLVSDNDPGNDPSAGSPTETLLRLLLPLNDQVRASSRPAVPHP